MSLARVAICASVCFALTGQVLADTVTLPQQSLATAEGNSQSMSPFGSHSSGWGGMTQVIYGSSLFSGIVGPITITGMQVRQGGENASHGGSEFTSNDFEVSLSSNTNQLNSYGNVFANNQGSDVTLVKDGSLSIGFDVSSGEPKNWSEIILFENSFIYDSSSNNNLVLTMENVSSPGGGWFTIDRHSMSGLDAVYVSSSGYVGGGDALVVQLTYTATSIPEPATLGLFGLILLGTVGRRRRA